MRVFSFCKDTNFLQVKWFLQKIFVFTLKMCRFAVQNLKANHNKDYSVVKTFKADVLSNQGIRFSFCVSGWGDEKSNPAGGRDCVIGVL
ncbi:MAG: hypothetical protein ACI38O_00005 [Fibrobacter intestinalis]|uniref:hypothetical protein n=1 Tax=Fibrobacter intestinalis TaxID=28122 RepID=UPI003F098D66